MLVVLHILSALSAAAGIAGYFCDITWLLIVGAAVSVLILPEIGTMNAVSCKLSSIVGAAIGMLIAHFCFAIRWGLGYALCLCILCAILALAGIISAVKEGV